MDEITYTAEQIAEHDARLLEGIAQDEALAAVVPTPPVYSAITYTVGQEDETEARKEIGVSDDAVMDEPPTLISVTVDETGQLLTMVFNKRLHGVDDALAAVDQFTLNWSGESGIQYSEGAGTDTVVCVITGDPITESAPVTLDYDAAEATVKDISAHPLNSFTDFAVTNEAAP